MGLDGGQLHVHDLADLRVALVGAHQPQHLQLRRRQRLVWGEPGLEEPGVAGRLGADLVHQTLVPPGAARPLQLLQQGQHRHAIDADGADELKLRRRVQGLRQLLPPALVPLSEEGDGAQDPQMDAVDVPGAGLDIGPQWGQRHQGRVGPSVGQLHHGLGQVLIAAHHVQMHRVPGGLVPIPAVGLVQAAQV